MIPPMRCRALRSGQKGEKELLFGCESVLRRQRNHFHVVVRCVLIYIHVLDFQLKSKSVQTSKLNNDSILRPCQMYSYEKKVYVYVVSVIYSYI